MATATMALKRFDKATVVAFGCVILLLAVGALIEPNFISLDYLLQQLQVASFLGVVASGSMLVILLGHIDLSIPWTIAIGGMMATAASGFLGPTLGVPLALPFGRLPLLEHRGLDPAHGLLFRNTRVGNPVQMARQQLRLVLRGEVSVAWDPDVVVVGDQIEDVLLQIRAGATDPVHLLVADQLREREPELGGTHRAGDGQEHLAAGIEQLPPPVRRFDDRRGVEVPEMVAQVIRNGTGHGDTITPVPIGIQPPTPLNPSPLTSLRLTS